jgi:hypothetical protein
MLQEFITYHRQTTIFLITAITQFIKIVFHTVIRMLKIRRMRGAGHVARMGAQINAYRVFLEQPEGNKPH